MAKLSIVIMAHPRRAEYIPYLKDKLGADTPVVFDTKNNIWDTCRRAWLAQDHSCDYALVIQDDAVICDNFRERAEKILDTLDEDVILSFFAGYMLGARIELALKHNRDFIETGVIYNEVALCMRSEHIEDMVEYCDKKETDTDQEISNWARFRHLKIRYTVPSLVDHRDDKSLYHEIYERPEHSRSRKAYKYVEN